MSPTHKPKPPDKGAPPEHKPSRKVALAWRTSFSRPKAVQAVADAILAVKLGCLKKVAA